MDWEKFPGDAKMEFLEPIPPGLEKTEFMALLQERIETRSLELLDYENLGALDPSLVGQQLENKSAIAAREAKEARQAELQAANEETSS